MRRKGLVLLAAALAAGLARPAGALHPARDRQAMAHRGGAAAAPENTLVAFENAAAVFASSLRHGREGWIEMDTQATADGVLVVIHDDSLDRTTDCSGDVAAMTYDEIDGCNAARLWPSFGFRPIPTLRSVLERGKAAGWRLCVEIKNIPTEANFDPAGRRLATLLVALVAETGFPRESLIVQSFWPPALDAVEMLDPEIDTMLLTTSTLPGAPRGVGFTLTEGAVYATARGYEYSAPDHQAADVTAEGIARAHTLGRRVVTWTVNDAARIAALFDAGIDGVMSDDPALLL